MLCLVFTYFFSGLPRPTMIYIVSPFLCSVSFPVFLFYQYFPALARNPGNRAGKISSPVTIHTHAGFRTDLRLFSVNCNDDAHKMPKSRHLDARVHQKRQPTVLCASTAFSLLIYSLISPLPDMPFTSRFYTINPYSFFPFLGAGLYCSSPDSI